MINSPARPSTWLRRVRAATMPSSPRGAGVVVPGSLAGIGGIGRLPNLVHHEGHPAAIRRPRRNVDGALAAEERRREIAHGTVLPVHEAKLDLLAERVRLPLVFEVREEYHPASVPRRVREPVGVGVASELLGLAAVGAHAPDLHVPAAE